MGISRLNSTLGNQIDLFTGLGGSGTIPFTLENEDGTGKNITGFTLRFRVMSSEFGSFDDFASATEVVDETDVVIVITDAVNGEFDVDLSGVTIATADVEADAVAILYHVVGSELIVDAQAFVNIRPAGTQ